MYSVLSKFTFASKLGFFFTRFHDHYFIKRCEKLGAIVNIKNEQLLLIWVTRRYYTALTLVLMQVNYYHY